MFPLRANHLQHLYLILCNDVDCKVIQIISRRFPTAAARVRNLGLVMWDFVMDKSGAGAGFLRELRFLYLANLHSICFSTIIFTITRGWHNRAGVAAVPIASQTK
jgi:hypothetical protein